MAVMGTRRPGCGVATVLGVLTLRPPAALTEER